MPPSPLSQRLAPPRELSARGAAALLAGLVVVSAVVRIVLARQVPSPFFFMDELGYERMADSIAHHGSLALFGTTGSAYAPLYPVVLAPIYALTRSAPHAYAASKCLNAVLLSLSALPVYGIARSLLPRWRSVGVASLSLIPPLMFYSALELSENLAYPLFLVAFWLLLRSLAAPSVRNDLLLLLAIALATAARLQSVALLPAALTAVLAAAAAAGTRGDRLASCGRALRAHAVLSAAAAFVLVGALVRTAANGGSIPLAGRYAEVGSARPGALEVLKEALWHVAELDAAIGLIPFALSAVAAYALVRLGFPRRALGFAAAAAATATWLVLEVAFDAAAFDRQYVQHVGEQLPRDAARIHERYLIYLVPLFLVALVAALRLARPVVRTRVHVLVAVAAAVLPLAIPLRTMLNDTSVSETFGLQVYAANVGGTILPWGHARLVVVIVGAVLALTYLYALLRPRPSFAVVITIFALVIGSSLVRIRVIGASQTIALPPAQARWVDRRVGAGSVVLVAGRPATRAAEVVTAFDNLTIDRLYYLCEPAFGTDFGERPFPGTVAAAYAVVPASAPFTGRVVARYRKGHLVLLAPRGGRLELPVGSRRRAGCG